MTAPYPEVKRLGEAAERFRTRIRWTGANSMLEEVLAQVCVQSRLPGGTEFGWGVATHIPSTSLRAGSNLPRSKGKGTWRSVAGQLVEELGYRLRHLPALGHVPHADLTPLDLVVAHDDNVVDAQGVGLA